MNEISVRSCHQVSYSSSATPNEIISYVIHKIIHSDAIYIRALKKKSKKSSTRVLLNATHETRGSVAVAEHVF